MMFGMRRWAQAMVLCSAMVAGPAWAGGPPRIPVFPGVVYHGPREGKRIALTFDACSSTHRDRVDLGVIDALIALDVPATLFLGGKWMRDQPAVVDALAHIPGFELATHGERHRHLTRLPDRAVQAEVEDAAREFEDVLGRKPTFIRAPYAELDARVTRLIEADGITPVQYDLPGADSTFSKKTLVRWVVGQARPGSIVVLHMNGHGKHTAEALPEIVGQLRAKGYTFVTVSELLGKQRPAPPRPILASATIDPDRPGPMCGPSFDDADDAPNTVAEP